MEKQILEILLDLKGEMKEFRSELQTTQADVRSISSDLKETQADVRKISSDLKETQTDVRNIRSDLKTTQDDVKEIKETVNRIEASQTEDVIAMLKVTRQSIESEFHYTNTRMTDMDKRVFNLENRVER
jgi:chromosome segregation ATPase